MTDPIGLWAAIEAIPGIGPYLPYLTLLITLAGSLAMALPHPTGTGGAYGIFYTVVNLIAQNAFKAKNATTSSGVSSVVTTPVIPTTTTTTTTTAVDIPPPPPRSIIRP